ncbi:MAG TPA: XRE family transcriptional regulator [Terrisporobacter glycolicus]|uniref:HTH-type transcriptional regulator PuuR n=1 Tax=Terrisporobacter petrolearius TaxID=1460447 RepID=A0ABZ3FBR8_9FIRM|nr:MULTISPECIES: cupin domain-containing protein [Terrisporobacter]UPA31813.1 cupin domain-containing protein [Terrisporobacter glycolicus]HBI94201.1 XRE family transcriptional regulator [Terrisporobacter hibernicus]
MKKDLDMNIDIGKKIRELRKSKNFSIIDLSKESGLSTGLISQIERNMVVPSIKVMWKIANVLEVNIGYFFDEDDENIEEKIVVRKDHRKSINTNDSTKSYELLMPNLNNKSIEFILITLDKETKINKELVSHKGEECGYIIEGKMKIILENKEYILEKGDSFYFDSKIPHVYENYGDETCVLVCAMTPPSF